MKHKISWLSALALAAIITSQLETIAATNGMIVITTRKSQDLTWGSTDSGNIMGPGQTSHGDVAMGAILSDYGYSSRFILDAELNPTQLNPYTGLPGDQNFYLFPANTNFTATLVINSGTSGSGDIGAPNTNGIPIIMGEHSCIGTGLRAAHNDIYLYTSSNDDDVKNDEGSQGGTNQYMKVLLPNHPIMQGIPLLPDGTVKIFRDPYPEEGGTPGYLGPLGAHTPVGGKRNYEYAWNVSDASAAAPGTKVIAVLPAPFDGRACFATADVGDQLADYTTSDPDHPWSTFYGDNKAHQRLVHWLINDQGSGGSRRCFNALTDIGRVIFIRTVKWALGETLAPYQPLNIKISALSNGSLQLEWTATADKNYKILGSGSISAPFFNWETLKQDIPGVNGTIQKTLDISAAPQVAFLTVAAVP